VAFYATNFIFDNIPSEMYGLVITSSGGESSTNASNDVDIKKQEIFRRPVPYFYGVSQSPVLEFEGEITSIEGEIPADRASIIQGWLFGRSEYKKLRIIQPDMEEVYFNCFLKSPQIKRIGNVIVGFSFTVECDSPFAWSNTKTIRYTKSNTSYTIYNESDNRFYTYPKLRIRMNGTANGHFILRNLSDNNRKFNLQGLSPGDTIIVENDLQIITANLTPNILNKLASPANFFRLVPGVNKLFLDANINTTEGVIIQYTPMKRMG
jgi:hypothetical protein